MIFNVTDYDVDGPGTMYSHTLEKDEFVTVADAFSSILVTEVVNSLTFSRTPFGRNIFQVFHNALKMTGEAKDRLQVRL